MVLLMRKFVIGGNWKMNRGTAQETKEMLVPFLKAVHTLKNVDIIVAPPFTALQTACDLIKGSMVKIGAQNMYPEVKGAFTGEISPVFLTALGVNWVILGHSERRHIVASETDILIFKKVKAALAAGLTPIVCVGEKLEEREKGNTEEVNRTQFEGSISGLSATEVTKIVIAYEPVWAIGTGKTATPVQAQEVHGFLRNLLTKKYGADIAQQVRIQYGGSVNDKNAKELFSQPDVDGGLVGGASLDPEAFAKICLIAAEIRK
ncbi:MAG: triosephosphate isomerase [Promethearchaeota archaeon CR_4]|nr:MAG: triosephosphate isomerase [Candidatus Lokiarchaeota archaeon CR_4]